MSMLMPIPKGVATPLSVQTFDGAPGGMARNAPQHEIQDSQAWTIIDANLNDPGLIRRRGPLNIQTTLTNSPAVGLARTQSADGTEQTIALTTAGWFGFGNSTALTDTYAYTPGIAPYEHFTAMDALNEGVFIGTAAAYTGGNRALSYWRGACKNAATVSLSGSVAIGDKTIGVSAATNVAVGSWIFTTSDTYVGCVKSISGTTLTLEHPALLAATTSIHVKSFRGVNPRVTVGTITCSSSDGTGTVNGGLTKFVAQGVGSGWNLYTQDFTYIGTVSAVASDTQLTLTTNPAVSLSSGAYVAIKNAGSYDVQTTAATLGFITASFAGHQFYATGNKLYFSDFTDPEALDLTADGDYLTFSQDPIRALVPTTQSLVVLTENDAFTLTGAIGTTPDNWRGSPVIDDGTICGMSAIGYQGGAIWAGKRGVWYYDGSSPVNIVDSLDGDYRLFVSTFDSASYRVTSSIVKDHLLLFIESGDSGVFQIIKGGQTTNITRATITVQLTTGVVAMWRNVEIRGAIYPPDSLALGTALLTVNDSTNGYIVPGEALFTGSFNDSITCAGGPGAGPDLYVETKKYNGGDPQRLKLFRMFLLGYEVTGGNIRMDTIPGLNGTGSTQKSEFLDSSGVWLDKRIKFNTRSQLVALRLYQSVIDGDPNQTGTSVGTATITIASPAVVTKSAHGLSNNQAVYFTTTGALPTGLTVNTLYYVYSINSSTFSLRTEPNGSRITTTGTQSGTHTLHSLPLAAITDATLASWALAFKVKRPGRV